MAQDSLAEDSGDIKRKALARLAVAGAVTVVTLGVLWWLDSSGDKPATPKKTPPAPIVSAPAPQTPPPTAAPEPVNDPNAPEAQPLEKLPPPPPPPEVISVTPQVTAQKPAAKAEPAPHPVQNVATTASKPAPVKPASPSQPTASISDANSSAMAHGFLVQMGVFTDPANATVLVERLRKAGIQASMETRVQLGPFRNRAEAEQAQAEARRLGIEGVIARK